MNLKEKLRHLVDISRRHRASGRTTEICRAAINLDGVVLAANLEQANWLRRSYSVLAQSIESYLYDHKGPFIFDHHTVEVLLETAANKIEDVERELDESITALNKKSKVITALYEQEIRRLKEEKQDLKNLLSKELGPVRAMQILKKRGYL